MIKKTKKTRINKKQYGGSGRGASASARNTNLEARLTSLKLPDVPIHYVDYKFLLFDDISKNINILYNQPFTKKNTTYIPIITNIIEILENFKKITKSNNKTNIEDIHKYLRNLYDNLNKLKILTLNQICLYFTRIDTLEKSMENLEYIDRYFLWIKYFHETAQKCLDESTKLKEEQFKKSQKSTKK